MKPSGDTILPLDLDGGKGGGFDWIRVRTWMRPTTYKVCLGEDKDLLGLWNGVASISGVLPTTAICFISFTIRVWWIGCGLLGPYDIGSLP